MPAHTHSGRWLSFLAAVLLAWTSGSGVQADVVLDGSLGSVGPLAGPDFMIDAVDGRTVGTNLFHSFGEFNLSSSQSATFTGPAAIANILGRITGGSASSIDGLLRSTIPDANLFLVNPNGIMFGPNASLDINGSFHASTSDYLGLADGTQFTALPSGQDALLTTATPAAFGFLGTSPGAIDINDSVLTVPDGKTLSLVGGDISITGSSDGRPPDLLDGTPGDPIVLGAGGGNINLVSVAAPGEATFASPLNADGFNDYGTITIKDSVLSVSADTSGDVYIHGGQIVVDRASVLSDTVSGNGGNITIKGNSVLVRRDTVSVRGENLPQIRASTAGVGDGGTIRIEAQSLTVDGGIYIDTHTVGAGRGGDIQLDVGRLEVRDTAFISTVTDGPGRGGDFHLNADSVLIFHGVASRLDTGISTDGGFGNPDATGDLGDMWVTARTVEVEGRDADFASSFTAGHGRAGDVVVNAESVVLREGGRLFNTTEGEGNPGDGGDVILNVGRLEVRSGGQITAGTFGGEGAGDGGDVILNVGRLEVRGGNVQTITAFSEGNAGDVRINADSILVSSDGTTENTTRISSFSIFSPGDGGDVFIDAGSLEIRDGIIFASALSSGSAGNVTIAVDSLLLDGGGTIVPRLLEPPTTPQECACLTLGTTHISTSSAFDFSGSSGNIDITAATVTVRGGAAINAITASDNPGGNVTINADTIRVETDARIDTGSIGAGPGGDIILSARDLTLASGGNLIASSTFGSGLAGDIFISLTDSFQSNGGFISTEALAADGGNITVNATNLVHLTNSSIATSVQGGAGAGGNISIDPQFVVLNNSSITANAFGGPGGNIKIVAGNFFATPDSVIQASSTQSIAGSIEIDSPDTDIAGSITALPESFLDASSLLPARCAARGGGGQSSFVVAGRGGMPIDPDGYLPSFHAADLTTLSASADSATDTIPETWISANDVALLALANSGCR